MSYISDENAKIFNNQNNELFLMSVAITTNE
jgi:hypothetical protein